MMFPLNHGVLAAQTESDGLLLAVAQNSGVNSVAILRESADWSLQPDAPDYPPSQAANNVAFSPDGSKLAVTGLGSSSAVFDTSDWELLNTISNPVPRSDYPQFFPGGDLLGLLGTGSGYGVYDLAASEVVASVTSSGAILGASIPASGDFLAVMYSQGDNLKIYETVEFSEVYANNLADGSEGVAYSADGSLLACGVANPAVGARIYNTSDWSTVPDIFCPGVVVQVSISPNNQYLALAMEDQGGMLVLNISDGSTASTLLDVGSAYDCQFSPDGAFLAYSAGSSVYIFSAADWSLVHQYDAPYEVYGMSWRSAS